MTMLANHAAAVLGIDAAWTRTAPSGVALVQSVSGRWLCRGAAPSYAGFIGLADGRAVDWSAPPQGCPPPVAELVDAAERLAHGSSPEVVAADIPLAVGPITGRRPADTQISQQFGACGCAVHSPTPDRPGPIGERLRDGCARAGYRLRTMRPGSGPALIETYPHPALLRLTGARYRLPYKVARASRYHPGESAAVRKARILAEQQRILAALRRHIDGILLPLPSTHDGVASLSMLKRFEDALDALVCCYVGICWLEGRARPYGDASAAIWLPDP